MFLQIPSEYTYFPVGQWNATVPFHAAQDFGGRQPFSLFIGLGYAEVTVEKLFFQCALFKFAVVFGHNPFVRPIEPIAFALVQFVHGLGVKLVVVYRTGSVDAARYFDADEPAAARGVGQQVLPVASVPPC